MSRVGKTVRELREILKQIDGIEDIFSAKTKIIVKISDESVRKYIPTTWNGVQLEIEFHRKEFGL